MKVEISLGMNCNASCIFCPSSKAIEKNIMPGQIAKKHLLEYFQKGYKEVSFTGGEPTIRKDLFELIGYAKNIGYQTVSITTNMLMLSYPCYVEKLKKSGIDKIVFSIFGFGNKNYEKITGIKKSFEYIKKGIKNLKNNKINSEAYILITKYSKKDLSKIVNFLLKNDIHSFWFWFISTKNLYNQEKDLMPKFSNFKKELFKAIDLIKYNNKNSVKVLHIPLCILDNKNKFYYNERKGKIIMQDLNSCFDLNKESLADYLKISKCKECKKLNVCLGLRKDYYEKFGDKEINPIKI